MDRNVRYHRLSSEEDNDSDLRTSYLTDIPAPQLSQLPSTAAAAVTQDQLQQTTSSDAMVGLQVVASSSTGDDFVAVPLSSCSSTPSVSASPAPPPYAATDDAASSVVITTANVGAPKYNVNVLPSYMIATELPTYDQVQQLKLEEQQQEPVLDPETLERGDALLGTDFMFLCAFFVAFLFNWIGFLMLMCFCPTIAGRYGALAGFGLSLAKWTLIVKHSTELIKTENNWLWWLILAFGVLICVRAVLQYLHVKREWGLLTRATQERLMYFY